MRYFHKLFFIGFILLCGSCFAQNASLSGVVTTEEGRLYNAHIRIEGSPFLTTTDSSGRFSFEAIPAGFYKLEITHIGYKPMYLSIRLKAQKTSFVSLRLIPATIDLKTVDIVPKIELAPSRLKGLDLQLRPVSSSQDLLRLVPGLFIAQHAGGGKAEQIFLRGFDVDHGTDFAIYVDGIPVNMPSHAHGQGYADLHFLIPETVGELEVNKGPHATRFGDLATAGSGEFKTLNKLANSSVKLEMGQFNTKRALVMVDLLSKRHSETNPNKSWYVAAEYRFTNSYFEQKQNFNRFNIFTKYNAVLKSGSKLTLSFSRFYSRWDASGQIPERKVNDGSISRFGSIDPTEGGFTGRTNANMLFEKTNGKRVVKHQLYYSRYDFNLYSNFTFYLKDSLNGDQINQTDNRNIFGYNLTNRINGKLFNKSLVTSIGAGIRYDNSQIALNHTLKQTFLNTVVSGTLNQINSWVYTDFVYAVHSKIKLNLGTRIDAYRFGFNNAMGDTTSQIAFNHTMSPKLNIDFSVKRNLSIYAKSGFGFHSNDARAVLFGNLNNGLARAFGNEVGTLFKPINGMLINCALWSIQLQNELVYVGDEGMVEAAGRTIRYGLDFGVRYQLFDYVYLDADISVNRGRLIDEPKRANRIPLAPNLTSTGGIIYKKPTGINGSLRYRLMGDRPAIEDNSIRAEGYFLVDFLLSYQYKSWQVAGSIENLLNSAWKEAQFATESKLQNEPNPVNEIHFTPGTPRFAKLSLTYSF
jgi:hypothetical protein